MSSDATRFVAHLKAASETVQGWPSWKQQILGGNVRHLRAVPGSSPDMETTIDDRIDMPVGDLVFWVTRLVDRSRQSETWTADEREWILNLHPEFFEVETQLAKCYAAIIRQRDCEIVEYARDHGIAVMPLMLHIAPLKAVSMIGDCMEAL